MGKKLNPYTKNLKRDVLCALNPIFKTLNVGIQEADDKGIEVFEKEKEWAFEWGFKIIEFLHGLHYEIKEDIEKRNKSVRKSD